MPIISKNQVLGLLTVFFANVVLYDSNQFHYLKSFCREVSVVAETSRLINNSILLQESNHRIKNNLQIISGLIEMQKLYIIEHPEADKKNILDSISLCIQNIAYLHDLLTSPSSNTNNIDLSRIINSTLRLYKMSNVTITVDTDELLIPYAKATPISMIINELVANCIKHAFGLPGQTDPQIHISCHIADEIITLSIKDNGSGIPDDIDIESTQSIGYSILRTIIHNELHGTLHVKRCMPGTEAIVKLPYISLITST